GLGGSSVTGTDAGTRSLASFGVTTPGRHPWGAGLTVSTSALDATAALADRGVRMTELSLSGRWTPARGWRLDAAAGRARFDGSEPNERTSGYVSLSRALGAGVSLGASVRS